MSSLPQPMRSAFLLASLFACCSAVVDVIPPALEFRRGWWDGALRFRDEAAEAEAVVKMKDSKQPTEEMPRAWPWRMLPRELQKAILAAAEAGVPNTPIRLLPTFNDGNTGEIFFTYNLPETWSLDTVLLVVVPLGAVGMLLFLVVGPVVLRRTLGVGLHRAKRRARPPPAAQGAVRRESALPTSRDRRQVSRRRTSADAICNAVPVRGMPVEGGACSQPLHASTDDRLKVAATAERAAHGQEARAQEAVAKEAPQKRRKEADAARCAPLERLAAETAFAADRTAAAERAAAAKAEAEAVAAAAAAAAAAAERVEAEAQRAAEAERPGGTVVHETTTMDDIVERALVERSLRRRRTSEGPGRTDDSTTLLSAAPAAAVGRASSEEKGESLGKEECPGWEDECPVCLEDGIHAPRDVAIIPCGHVLCTPCAHRVAPSGEPTKPCPICGQAAQGTLRLFH